MISNVKQKLIELSDRVLRQMEKIQSNPVLVQEYFKAVAGKFPNMSFMDLAAQIQVEIVGLKEMGSVARDSQTIVFSAKQAEVFWSLVDKYESPLDYKLPFPDTLIQFDDPVAIDILNRSVSETSLTKDYIIGMLLHQREITKEDVVRLKEKMKNPLNLLSVSDNLLDGESILNGAHFIFTDWNHARLSWKSNSKYELAKFPYTGQIGNLIDEQLVKMKKLAIACIGYINCENIYLHQQRDVSDKINEKRERKGKSRLDPYYVCRIRGVQYDSSGMETGLGSKHGIRYDVRGHFRHLSNGKTTWVRPHQRGLENEIYIPKMYVVDRKGE